MPINAVVERAALHRALKPAHRAARGNPLIPILNHVLVKADDGRLSVEGTNLVLLARTTVKADVRDVGSACVLAERLYRVVDSLPEGAEVSFRQDEKTLTVVSGRTRASLPTLPEADWPAMGLDGAKVSVVADVPSLRAALAFCRDSVNDSGSQPAFDGIRLEAGKDGHPQATSYAGTTIANAPFDATSEGGSIDVTVPSHAVDAIVDVLPKGSGQVRLDLSDRLIVARSGDVVIAAKLLDTTWPEWRVILSRAEPTFEARVNPQDLLAAIKRVDAATDGHDVHLTIGEGRIRVFGRGDPGSKSKAWGVEAEDEAAATVSAECISGARPRQLRDSIEALLLLDPEADEITIRGNPGNKEPLRFTLGPDRPGIRLVMPCLVQGPSATGGAA